jgi:hypothetical protein
MTLEIITCILKIVIIKKIAHMKQIVTIAFWNGNVCLGLLILYRYKHMSIQRPLLRQHYTNTSEPVVGYE